jgi:molybdate transport system substrate-binding protein
VGAHREDLGREARLMATPVLFIAAGASQGLVTSVAGAAGVEVGGSFGAVGAMLDRFKAGEPCDVVILTHAQIAELAGAGKVLGDTCADLGSVPTAVAVRAGDEAIDISSEEALRAALLAADAIYFPDPDKSTAGGHFSKVIDRLGIRPQVASRLRVFPNGMTAMRTMGEAPGKPIGCTQTTEIFATPSVKLVAPLPHGFDLDTVYSAAVNAGAAHPEAARAFLARLAGEASRKARIAAGFRGYAIRPATGADLEAIRGLVRDVLHEYGLSEDPSGVDADLEDLDRHYFHRGGVFDVAVAADGKVAGCCGVFRLEGDACELRKMYVLKDARGHGLGGRLLRRAVGFARGQGYRRMELETASVLKEAIALYAGAGFRPIKRAHMASRCDQAFALDL